MSAGVEPHSIETLRTELTATRRHEAELRELLAKAHEQLALRDDDIVQELVWRSRVAQQRAKELEAHLRLAQQQIEAMRQTRAWRLATTFWDAKARVRRFLRRR